MRVLVTGGTGFVGGWTAKAVADAGHSVRFLVRNPDRLHTSVAKLGVDLSDFAVGDITDRVSVRDALRGCDAVVHSAALVATDPRQTNEMLTTNMQGAQNVLGQSVELGLDPIIHVSSFTALFHPGLEVLTADLPVVGGADGYGTSKAQVEIYARGLQDAGAPVNITYPGMVLGPPVGDQFGEAGDVLDRAGRFLPFDTPFTSAGMQYYTQMPASDDSPSEQDLGITYRDPQETLADTFEALRAASS